MLDNQLMNVTIKDQPELRVLLEMPGPDHGPPEGGRHVLSVGDILETADRESAISNP